MASSHVALITAGGTSNRRIASSLYGYCTTAAGTTAKTVTLYTGNGTSTDGTWASADLFHGLTITVRFQYSNTATNPTLNVNSTGAKRIYKWGTTSPGTTASTSWQAQSVVSLTYDTLLNSSGCWVMNDHLDDNTGGGGATYVAVTGKPTSNQTPGFGDSVTISQIEQDTTGQMSATDRTITIPSTVATSSTAGLMSASDKDKLDGVQSGAEVNVQSDWTEADSTSDAYIQNKPSLATVATSGDYTDLSNTPTIPTVNDATLTIQQNGTTIDTFTANSSTNTTVNVTSPTFDDIYPVGSIYMSVNSTNPGNYFGGTWTRIRDTFLLAAGSTYSAGDTGGSATHTLTVGQLPTVTSYFDIRAWGTGNAITVGTHYTSGNGSAMNNIPTTGNTSRTSQRVTHTFGSGNAHNNMPPYLVVYVWQRTA